MVWKPRPISPDTGEVSRFEEIWVTTAEGLRQPNPSYRELGRHTECL